MNNPICKNEAQQNGGSSFKPKPKRTQTKQVAIPNNIIESINIELIIFLIIILVCFFISP
jgi:hypothetical protein